MIIGVLILSAYFLGSTMLNLLFLLPEASLLFKLFSYDFSEFFNITFCNISAYVAVPDLVLGSSFSSSTTILFSVCINQLGKSLSRYD